VTNQQNQLEEEYPVSLPYENLPEKISKINSVLIRSIEVEVEIGEQEGYLNFGGWVQNLNSENLPLVISIHRFGLRYLSPDFNIHETFYNVDKLKLNDTLELVWRENKYVYKVVDIYKATNNKPIRDDQLLVYTCKYWDSAERVFTVWEKVT
jgi:sortase (surface protein transpeptidase)